MLDMKYLLFLALFMIQTSVVALPVPEFLNLAQIMLSQRVLELLFYIMLFAIVPYEYFIVRAALSLFLTFQIYQSATYLFYFVSNNLSNIFSVLDVILFIVLVCTWVNYTINYYLDFKVSHKSESLKSFDLDPNFIYIILKKPVRVLPTISSILGDPYSSVSIASIDGWYSFRRSTSSLKGLQLSSIKLLKKAFSTNNRYVVYKLCVSTRERRDLLNSLIRTRYAVMNNNCVTVFKGLFSSIGVELSSFLDRFPSIAILKLKNNFISLNY